MSVAPCFTTVSLARYLRRRTDDVRQLVRSGEIRGFISGNRIRISPEAVKEYEQKHCVRQEKKTRRRERKPADYVEYYG